MDNKIERDHTLAVELVRRLNLLCEDEKVRAVVDALTGRRVYTGDPEFPMLTTGELRFGILGLLNGLCGVNEPTNAICGVYSGATGELEGFAIAHPATYLRIETLEDLDKAGP